MLTYHLVLSRNKIRKIPDLTSLTLIEKLSLSGNKIKVKITKINYNNFRIFQIFKILKH